MNIKYTHIATLILCLIVCSCSNQLSSVSAQRNKNKTENKKTAEYKELFFKAQTEKAIGNTEKAYNAFMACLEIIPDDDVVLYELARLEMDMDNSSTAIDYMKRALDVSPDNKWYHLLLGDLYYESANLSLAEKEYRAIIEISDDQHESYFKLATVLLQQEKPQKAIDVYNQLEKQIGVNEELCIQKQRIYFLMGKDDKAMGEMQKLVEAYPKNMDYLAMLASYYVEIGEQEKAVEMFEKMTSIDPNNGILHMQLSEYYASIYKDKESFEAMKLAFKSDEISIDEKVSVLLKFFTISEFDATALSQAHELLEITELANPNEAKTFAIYGDYLYRERKFELAREKYRRAIDFDKSRDLIWIQLLTIELNLSDYTALKMESAEALELFPVIPDFYLYNGLALVQLKEYEDGIKSLNLGKDFVIENDGMSSQFYSSLGDAYHQTEQHDKSDASYDKALKYDPQNVFVLNNFSYYLSLRNVNLPKAAEMAARANELAPGRPSFQDTYAWILYMMGDYEKAKLWLEQAMNNGGASSGEILEHYGDTLFKLGREEEAVEHWRMAKEAGLKSETLEKKITDKTLHD